MGGREFPQNCPGIARANLGVAIINTRSVRGDNLPRSQGNALGIAEILDSIMELWGCADSSGIGLRCDEYGDRRTITADSQLF